MDKQHQNIFKTKSLEFRSFFFNNHLNLGPLISSLMVPKILIKRIHKKTTVKTWAKQDYTKIANNNIIKVNLCCLTSSPGHSSISMSRNKNLWFFLCTAKLQPCSGKRKKDWDALQVCRIKYPLKLLKWKTRTWNFKNSGTYILQ